MKEKYKIHLIGCDDTTRFYMELEPEEAALLDKVAYISQETSTCVCMPKMKIFKEVKDEDNL